MPVFHLTRGPSLEWIHVPATDLKVAQEIAAILTDATGEIWSVWEDVEKEQRKPRKGCLH